MGSRMALAQQGYRAIWQRLRPVSGLPLGRWSDLAAYAGLALLAFAILFHGIGDIGILDGNESLYVEAAREMLQTGDWAVPTLDGLPYLEKPPLFVWLLAAASHSGFSIEGAARLVSGAAVLVLALGVGRYALRLGIEGRGIVAPFVLLTSLGVAIMGRVAMPDLLLTALFGLACLGFLMALHEGRARPARIAAGLLGAASLVKGALPIALFALIVAACYAIEKPWRPAIRRLLGDPVAIALLCLPICIWLVAIDTALPGAASYFIVEEHVLRFLGLREPHDYYSGSPLYYLPRLFLFFFPWPAALAAGWLAKRHCGDAGQRRVRRYLWLCVWIPLSFFSLSNAKANYYIVVCLPAMALLTADALPALLEPRRRVAQAIAVLLPGALLAGVVVVAMTGAGGNAAALLAPLRDGGAAGTGLALAALSAGALAFVTARRGALAFALLGFSSLPLLLEVQRLAVDADASISARAAAVYIRSHYDPETPVYLFEDFESAGALPIYLGRTVPVVDSKSNDLHYGRRVLRRHPSLVGADGVPRNAVVVVLKNRRADFARSPLAARSVSVVDIGRAGLYLVAD